mgnify:CR=1 FL=1
MVIRNEKKIWLILHLSRTKVWSNLSIKKAGNIKNKNKSEMRAIKNWYHKIKNVTKGFKCAIIEEVKDKNKEWKERDIDFG